MDQAISGLERSVIYVAKTTANFKPQLDRLTVTLQRIAPIIQDTVNMNRSIDRAEAECKMFIRIIEEANTLVDDCLKVKRDPIKKLLYSWKLKSYEQELRRFFRIEVQAMQSRDNTQMLLGMDDLHEKIDRLSSEVKDMGSRRSSIGHPSGSMSTSSRTDQSGSDIVKREWYGWQVPALPNGIVAFDEPLAKLKEEVVAGIGRDDDSSSMDCDDRQVMKEEVVAGIDRDDDSNSMDCDNQHVLVVAAAGGCGKTTLVKMLCHDPEIREIFGENILFKTISEIPKFMVIVNELFNPNLSSPQVLVQSNEDAKNKLENFLNQVSGPMLLVLDDVWSDSFINNFPSNNRGCKILVTSRTAFRNSNYDMFQFDPLNEKDAKTLFCRSAFSKGGRRRSPKINDDLVNQMVTCCKRHPLTLSVVGRSLNGKNEFEWQSMLNSLSRGRSVLDLHEDVLIVLERSFEALNNEFKECFLDFGLFPEDQRIPVSTLLNMWVHLYNHDDDGVDTLTNIYELSDRNLVDIMATGFKDESVARVNHCDQQFVTQHDLLRELAIHLNSKLPLPQRSRLIINVKGDDFSAYIGHIQEPMQARILSISTGDTFASKWCNLEVPNLEVLILNLMSEMYNLPRFLAGNPKLKVLNITNHGLYPTQFNNFQFLTSSNSLTRIRLERVTISPFILALVNLQNVSLIMCKMDDNFKNRMIKTPNIWPQLVEIEIDYCQDLVKFPRTLCRSVHLKKISITNCNEMCEINEELGDLINLETLILRSCTKLEKLPESIWRLEKLSVLDISDCLSLSGLPEKMGKLGGLRTIYMKGCTGVHELPESVKDLSHVRVVCDEEVAHQWKDYGNVEIDLVEEDRLGTLMKII